MERGHSFGYGFFRFLGAWYKTSGIVHPNLEVIRLDQQKQNKLQEKKDHDKFNSVTQKNKVENQNQTHNSRKEGIAPINQKR